MTRPDADWMTQAACRGTDTAVFFPEIPVGAGAVIMDRLYATAKAFCRLCPVREQCLAYCLPFEKETGRRDGMYGGTTPQQRAKLTRR